MDDPAASLKDAAYVVIGLGVMSFQRAQVRHRQIERQLERDGGLRATVARLAAEIEERVDPALDDVEARLGPPAQDLLRQARSVARDVRTRLAS